MATSIVPVRVPRGRWRYPLRWVVRMSEGLPYSAPATASASAESNALIVVCSR